jgi:3'-phosphoadenosine 5'-phosphosulfate sulfotransferase (PAPS reductase)/FAD synthetase
MRPAISTISEIDVLIAADAPVAIGVSGGKDSQAAALATVEHLDSVGHHGPRVLIHSDLGVVEWNESLPVCRGLAEHLGVELIVVRRKAGDLMDRWEARWQSSMRRYVDLETVALVLPWSTPSMRFCTSELKTHIIGAELRRRFKGQTYINVTGVRREESAARAKGQTASQDADGRAWNWRPISDWKTAEVFTYIAESGLEVHQAYTEFGMSRVSCRFCIMSNVSDIAAAAAVPESQELYCRMVDLEIASTFAFQGNRWLGDAKPRALGVARFEQLANAKLRAAARVAVESRITKDMRYVAGWPTRMLTDAEATLLAQTRRRVGELIGVKPKFLTAPEIHERYADLMAKRELKKAA